MDKLVSAVNVEVKEASEDIILTIRVPILFGCSDKEWCQLRSMIIKELIKDQVFGVKDNKVMSVADSLKAYEDWHSTCTECEHVS